MVLTVPPIRKSMGWKPAEKIPTTYPREYSRACPKGWRWANTPPRAQDAESRANTQSPTGLAGQLSASRTTRSKSNALMARATWSEAEPSGVEWSGESWS